jgi:ribulose-5-phosphate 4-epimerase/fuculose-1-phosphate aldolase
MPDTIMTKPSFASLKGKVSPEEWQARVELACCYRLMHHFGWSGTNFGTHLSARVPGETEHMLLNPVSVKFDQITASSLIKLHLDGKRLTESPYRVNGAGIAFHGGVYWHRPDAMGALHSHSESGVAISMLKCGLQFTSLTSARFFNRIGYYDFKGPGDNKEERVHLAKALGPHLALIMRNHGLLTVGRTIGEAMVVMVVLEQVIATQLRAMATGAELLYPSEEIMEKCARDRDARSDRNNKRDWESLMEQVDRIDPSYRD